MGAVSEYVASLNEEQQRHASVFSAFMSRAIKEVAYVQGNSAKEMEQDVSPKEATAKN